MAAKFKKESDSTSGDLEIDAEESETAKLWLKWCRAKKDVKCSESEVPDGILPKQYKGVLIDVKVSARGPDDKLYGAHEDLRKNVARGNCVLELQKKSTNETHFIFMIYALKKFSGGMGDEDDSPGFQNIWQNYFLKTKENAVKVVCTKKANGEAAHSSSRKLFNQDFFCVGSKNVHLLVKNQEEIQQYTDSRYMVAKTVAEAFFSNIINNPLMRPEDLLKLVQFLQNEKCTMVSEILQPQYQHIENLSYLTSPKLLFICWTTYKLIDEETSTLCLKRPDIAINEAREFGLNTVDYEVIDAESSEDYMSKVRSEFGYEGRVLYFLDDKENVIGVLKKKTAWYIILRSIREKVCHFCSKKDNSSNSENHKKIFKRITEIQSWIGFSDEYLRLWKKLGAAFVDWLLGNKIGKDNMTVRSQFPIIWKQFLDGNEEMSELYSFLQSNYS